MKVIETSLEGVKIIEPRVFEDSRGYFFETWQKERYVNCGIGAAFIQDNLSFSTRGVLRGLHFQDPNSQAKLVCALQGEVFDVAVDIRKGSPTFGKWEGVTLSENNRRQLYVPEGFAHGFLVTSETAMLSYKCSDIYNPQSEKTIIWNDPDIGVTWPIENPILSEKDAKGVRLKDYD